ncbi:MAG: ATP-binding cassette domain-containing protein [Opitutales bacterium]
MADAPPEPLLAVEDLHISFGEGHERVEAVRGVGFAVSAGEVHAFIGESGSGKSVTSRALARLLPPPPHAVVTGRVRFAGKDVLALSRHALRRLRGRGLAYVFQEPSAAINPAMRIGPQLLEILRVHRPEVDDRRHAALEWLDRVRLPRAAERFRAYPHELSGGMLQRVVIALALACGPRLLIADEPTTALDVTVEREIIDLLASLQQELGLTVLLITHNFGIVQGFAEHVHVMRQGEIVENGPTDRILRAPSHPYTEALIRCRPRLGAPQSRLYTTPALSH